MATIYIVTSGEYSDYGINAVFDDKEKAEQWIKEKRVIDYLEAGDYDIEEYKLNPTMPDEYRQGMLPYDVWIRRSGDIQTITRYYDAGFDDKFHVMCFPNSCIGSTIVWARDKQHAAKIANERRVRAIVDGTWPEDGK
jgi:hypothetical protein